MVIFGTVRRPVTLLLCSPRAVHRFTHSLGRGVPLGLQVTVIRDISAFHASELRQHLDVRELDSSDADQVPGAVRNTLSVVTER